MSTFSVTVTVTPADARKCGDCQFQRHVWSHSWCELFRLQSGERPVLPHCSDGTVERCKPCRDAEKRAKEQP